MRLRARARAAATKLLAALALVSAGFFLPVVHAASLQVTPISVDFGVKDQSRSLWLSNTGNSELRAQVRVFVWTQENGQDKLEPTREVVASPSMVTIPPKGRQLVRLVRLNVASAGVERSYRLMVNELPVSDGKEQSSGLSFLLQYSIPVFIAPLRSASEEADQSAAAEADTLRVSLKKRKDGEFLFTAINKGVRRHKIADLEVRGPDGKQIVLAQGLLGYVLAGQERSWALKLNPPVEIGAGELKARLVDGANAQILQRVEPGG